MWRHFGCGIGLAVFVRRVDGGAAFALVAGPLKPPTDFLLLVSGRVTACEDLRHSAGLRRADSEALDANRSQDDSPMAEVNHPE